MRTFLATLGAAAIAAAGAFAVADAAEPSSGSISNAKPKVEWGGTLANSGITNNAWSNDPEFPCNPPACDTFALKVENAGNVTVTLNMLSTNADGSDPGCGIRIIDASGAAKWYDGSCSEKTAMKVVLKNAPAGDYTIDVASSHICCGTEDYLASAFLPSTAPVGGTPPPVATVAPAPTPAPASETKITAKAPTLSARKLRKSKKFVATLTSNGLITNVNAVLVNKKKKFGSGKLGSLNGTAKMTVKVKRRLKPGTYELGVGGKDTQGRNVVTTIKVKVKK